MSSIASCARYVAVIVSFVILAYVEALEAAVRGPMITSVMMNTETMVSTRVNPRKFVVVNSCFSIYYQMSISLDEALVCILKGTAGVVLFLGTVVPDKMTVVSGWLISDCELKSFVPDTEFAPLTK